MGPDEKLYKAIRALLLRLKTFSEDRQALIAKEVRAVEAAIEAATAQRKLF